jgi:3'(2'), 5'-bisphosphate nucleotidase
MLATKAANRTRLMRALLEFAVAAGGVITDYVQGEMTVERNPDGSPVTPADHLAEAIILAGIAHAAPGIPAVAEEEAAAGRVPTVADRFFLVDALDGTKEFISGGTDFTVNIGLIEHGNPTLGVVYAPARSMLYWGDTEIAQAWQAPQPPHSLRGTEMPIAVGKPRRALRAVASKSHNTPETEAWLRGAGVQNRVSIGSSLKFVLVATGEADVYPRLAPTMEWDTAAGDAILRAAGGRVLDLDGNALTYGKPRFYNPGFLATGRYEPAPIRPYMAMALESASASASHR